jgi:hypothetical protein
VHQAPGIPHALVSWAKDFINDSGALRGEVAKSYLEFEQRHCEERSDEAIHSFFAARWIASRSLSSGAHSRDPLARNDNMAV